MRILSWTDLKCVAVKYVRFPLFSTLTGLVSAVSTQGPYLLFGILFSLSDAGLYFLINRILSVPISLVGDALGKSFFASAAEAARKGDLYRLTIKTLKPLILASIPIVIVVGLLDKKVITFILGSDWSQATDIIGWMVVSTIAQFITSPVGHIFAIQSKQNIGLFMQIILLILKVAGIVIGYLQKDFFSAVAYFSILSAIGYILFLTTSVYYSRKINNV